MHNKKNNQLIINLPRKELGFLKGKDAPKYVNLKIGKNDFEW